MCVCACVFLKCVCAHTKERQLETPQNTEPITTTTYKKAIPVQ